MRITHCVRIYIHVHAQRQPLLDRIADVLTHSTLFQIYMWISSLGLCICNIMYLRYSIPFIELSTKLIIGLSIYTYTGYGWPPNSPPPHLPIGLVVFLISISCIILILQLICRLCIITPALIPNHYSFFAPRNDSNMFF